MDKTKSQKKAQKQVKHTAILESLKDIGGTVGKSFKKDLLGETSKDFLQQILGTVPPKKVSGEIMPGEALEINEALSETRIENEKLKKQIFLEKKLKEEERKRLKEKSSELKLRLHALQQEVAALASTTHNLAQETQIAAMQAPVEPGVYHIVFFEKLIEFLKSFRKRIEEASVWLQAANKRAQKKNYWARYKKHGGKFLLAADHYLSRSAG
jgi:DNA repair exonuclease SbcCD ATPase subunit